MYEVANQICLQLAPLPLLLSDGLFEDKLAEIVFLASVFLTFLDFVLTLPDGCKLCFVNIGLPLKASAGFLHID